ncbi:LEA14-like dessication related protein [Spirosomataceae bacterium TFI 002]|nr:LEA14-like dessication related protein [Spirosomataceae bacterium TFI 002]
MPKNKWFWILLVVISITLLVSVFSKKISVLPKIGIVVLQVTDSGKEDIDMLVQLNIKNKTPFYFSSDSVFVSVYANDVQILKSKAYAQANVSAFGRGNIDIPIRVDVPNLRSLSSSPKLGVIDSCHYKLIVSMSDSKNFLLPDSFTITQEAYLPLFKLPNVTLISSEVKNIFKKDEAKVLLELEVTNFNTVEIVLKNPKYSASFGNDMPVMEGALDRLVVIPPLSRKRITIPLSLDVKKLLGKTGKILFNKDDLDVKLVLEGEIQSPHEILENFRIKSVVNSDLKTLIK